MKNRGFGHLKTRLVYHKLFYHGSLLFATELESCAAPSTLTTVYLKPPSSNQWKDWVDRFGQNLPRRNLKIWSSCEKSRVFKDHHSYLAISILEPYPSFLFSLAHLLVSSPQRLSKIVSGSSHVMCACWNLGNAALSLWAEVYWRPRCESCGSTAGPATGARYNAPFLALEGDFLLALGVGDGRRCNWPFNLGLQT